MKVSLGKRLQSVVVVLVTKLQDEKFEKKNFDFLSSRVKRVKSCRFAKAKPIAFISVFVAVARSFRDHRDIRYGRAFRMAHCQLLTYLQMNVFIDYSSVKHIIF